MYYYNQNDYGNVKYDRPNTAQTETVATSGCGPVAACIAVNNLIGKELFTVASMAQFSLDSGARDNSGTNLNVLLKAICNKYKDFSFTTTNDENAVVANLKNGGIVISNQGDAYNVFSTAGHFVVLYKMSGNDIEVLDPQIYSGKYDAYSRPQRIVKKTANGCIVSVSELAKATADRNPAHYLISYSKPKSADDSAVTSTHAPTYKVGGVYTLDTNLNVRKGAGTNYAIKKYSDLTKDGKNHATVKSNSANAVLQKGTRVTAQKVINVGNDIWLQIPSGYIAAYYDGNIYVK